MSRRPTRDPQPAFDSREDKEATLLLLPAYGRKYTDIPSMLADWEIGKDFKIHRGFHTNKFDTNLMIAQGIRAIWLQGSYLADAPTVRIDLSPSTFTSKE